MRAAGVRACSARAGTARVRARRVCIARAAQPRRGPAPMHPILAAAPELAGRVDTPEGPRNVVRPPWECIFLCLHVLLL